MKFKTAENMIRWILFKDFVGKFFYKHFGKRYEVYKWLAIVVWMERTKRLHYLRDAPYHVVVTFIGLNPQSQDFASGRFDEESLTVMQRVSVVALQEAELRMRRNTLKFRQMFEELDRTYPLLRQNNPNFGDYEQILHDTEEERRKHLRLIHGGKKDD